MRRRKRGNASGFTLIEVMVALVVSAIVLLGARAMLGAVGDAAARVSAEGARLDMNANAEHALRALVRNLDLGFANEAVFAGDARQVTFVSWCDTPSGWQERCRIAIAIEKREGGDALVVRAARGDAIVVRDSVRNGSLRYLTTVYGGGEWIRTWGAGITAPLAIGIILDADTLIVPIGERG
jgi:prepilin-type N-terminal cleavage/methylation domain-containing protein